MWNEWEVGRWKWEASRDIRRLPTPHFHLPTSLQVNKILKKLGQKLKN